jgi:NADPH-dependent 2,4-dienoyl-CoA reductase/sulfur reductase-like enzyme
MPSESQSRFDVLVIGGGPAGMAAAVRAAECGVRVGIVDDNPALGGQIWRGSRESLSEDAHANEAARWRAKVHSAGVAILCGMKVFHQPEPGVLLAESADDLFELKYTRLILATGARERFLPFPGWTLPNVMGAGGLQAMVKSGLPIAGKRVVVAGTGPLLLAVAAYLRKHGAQIPVICEQASWSKLARFGMALIGQPKKILQGLQLKRDLGGVPFAANSWPLAAHGMNALESVTISRTGKSENITCDYLACGFHLVPNIELPLLLGCQVRGGYVQVDDFQQTTVSGIFCAGEPTSIGGVESALVEGKIAGLAAGGRQEEARKLFPDRAKATHFAHVLDETFRLRCELRRLASPETIICRCEDVTHSRLQEHASWRAAKLHTRCGMGPCQGRICGPATQFLFKWNPDSVRPPVFPARVENLAAVAKHSDVESSATVGGSR